MKELFELLSNQQKAEIRKKCFDKVCQAIDNIEINTVVIDLSEDITKILKDVLDRDGDLAAEYADIDGPLSNIFEMVFKKIENLMKVQLGF